MILSERSPQQPGGEVGQRQVHPDDQGSEYQRGDPVHDQQAGKIRLQGGRLGIDQQRLGAEQHPNDYRREASDPSVPRPMVGWFVTKVDPGPAQPTRPAWPSKSDDRRGDLRLAPASLWLASQARPLHRLVRHIDLHCPWVCGIRSALWERAPRAVGGA
jgi:hypothetical protein